MPEQKSTAESQHEKQRVRQVRPREAAAEAAKQSTLGEAPGGPFGPPGDISIQDMAARLGDARFQTAQR